MTNRGARRGTTRKRGRYTIIGCSNCGELWIVEDLHTQETVQCTRCGKEFPEHTRRGFVATDDYEDAVARRSALLLKRSDVPGDRYIRDFSHEEMAARARGGVVSHEHSDLWADRVANRDPLQIHPDAGLWETLVNDEWSGVEHPDAEVWESVVRTRLRSSEDELDDNRDRPGITSIYPPAQVQINTITQLRGIGPRYSEWLPELIEDLLEPTANALEDLIDEEGLSVIEEILPAGTENGWTEGQRAGANWLLTLQEFIELREDPQNHSEELADVRQALTRFAIGDGSFNAGLSALYYGPMAVHRRADTDGRLRCFLDADTWQELSDPRTGRRALAALSILGVGLSVEVVLSSPILQQVLSRRFSQWVETNLDLTEQWNGSRDQNPQLESLEARVDAYETLSELPDESKQTRLLAALPSSDARRVKTIKDDPDVDASPGSIDRYLPEFEQLGLVDIERYASESNRVTLTHSGQVAQQCITKDGRIKDPFQTQLQEIDGYRTETIQPAVGRVYGASESRERDRTIPGESLDEWLRDTGRIEEGASYQQWLDGPGERSAWETHRILTAASVVDGINLVDCQPMGRFEDPRVSYLSGNWDDDAPDDVLVVTEYGGPLGTLARITATLLSNQAFARFLTRERIGFEWEQLHEDQQADMEESVRELLQLGRQIGWLSADEETYGDWQARIKAVRNGLLERLVGGTDELEPDEWAELARNLHGLLASATHLYDAAGFDVTINVRVPDTANLCADEKRRRQFLDLLAYTVPKQTVYKHHSGYRQLLEHDEEKLRYRLGIDVDPDAVEMAVTASWVISGRSATELRTPIERRMAALDAEVRDAVGDGDEDAPVMTIPIEESNRYGAIKRIVESFADRKGYRVLGEESVRGHAPSAHELLRVLLRALARPETPHRACPYAIAEAMLSLGRSTVTGARWLRKRDLEYGLSQVHPDVAFPWLTEGETRLLQALLAADEPLSYSELTSEIVSESTFARARKELSCLDLVQQVEVNGRNQWRATITPWWSTNQERPADGSPFLESARGRDMVYELLDLVPDAVRATVEDYFYFPPDLEAVFEEAPAVARWRAFIQNTLSTARLMRLPPPEYERAPVGDSVVRIGRLPAGMQPGQYSLERRKPPEETAEW